jgi:hypothetical protein
MIIRKQWPKSPIKCEIVLTPGKVYWLLKALIAMSASLNVEYFTKQLPVKVKQN